MPAPSRSHRQSNWSLVCSFAFGYLTLVGACAGNESTNGSGGSGGTPGSGGRVSTGSGGAVGTASGGASATGGASASGGAPATGSGGAIVTGTGGSSAGTGGSPATGSGGSSVATGGRGGGTVPASGGATDSGGGAGAVGRFSFFVTSLSAMRQLSGSQNGFGGDLRFGEADGLTGADKICTMTANRAVPGNGKTWRAFLSVGANAVGGAVNAIDRVGTGPWYDRLGRPVATNRAALLNARPQGADTAIINDLPNEQGIPNHFDGAPGCTSTCPDNHHVLTGSNATGGLYSATGTCSNWTSTAPTSGRPRIGFSWIAASRTHWISGQDEGGCGAGVNLAETGGSDPSNPIVGSGGGYGAIYCFALTP